MKKSAKKSATPKSAKKVSTAKKIVTTVKKAVTKLVASARGINYRAILDRYVKEWPEHATTAVRCGACKRLGRGLVPITGPVVESRQRFVVFDSGPCGHTSNISRGWLISVGAEQAEADGPKALSAFVSHAENAEWKIGKKNWNECGPRTFQAVFVEYGGDFKQVPDPVKPEKEKAAKTEKKEAAAA